MNQLFHGDCLEIMSTLPDGCVDMVFADLPYGSTQNSWDSIIPFDKLWASYKRVVKEDGAIILTAQPPFDKILACSNLKDFRYEWIWEKNKATGHLNAKKMPMKAHENVLVFYRKLPTYNPQKTTGHKPFGAVKPRDNIPPPDKKRNYNHVEKTHTISCWRCDAFREARETYQKYNNFIINQYILNKLNNSMYI